MKQEPRKSPGKRNLLRGMAATTGLKLRQIAAVLDALAKEMQKVFAAPGPALFSIPGLIRIEKREISARPAREGVPGLLRHNELRNLPARPGRTKIKVRALKDLRRRVSPQALR